MTEREGRARSGAEDAASALEHKLEECRKNIELIEKELEDCRRRARELEKGLWGLPETVEPAPAGEATAAAPLLDDESEADRKLSRIQDRIREIIRAEIMRLERKPGPPAGVGETMVCPSCGGIAARTDECCPQCRARTEPAEGGGDRRVFPLSAEKFLYIFNDRFGWFTRAFDKATHYADRKGEYDQAADFLKVLIQFMEENIDLLKSKHRDFKLALAYAYIGRCSFQAGDADAAIRYYKRGVLLKASNSYNCEIGMVAVYRSLVKGVLETGTPLSGEAYPSLSGTEIRELNALGLGARGDAA
ncbi:MAG: hypothetical protein PHN82_08300 [bacterium]|nr:hypothetical protein [bacterium]